MVSLQCNKCGVLRDIEVSVELPMHDCIALYVKHIKAEHSLEKLSTMVHEKYYERAAKLYNE